MPSAQTIIVSALTGAIYAGGWWVFLDGIINAPEPFPWFHIIPVFGMTVSILAINMVSPNSLDSWDHGGPLKCWLFTWFTFAMTFVGIAIWITAVEYPTGYNWPGVAIILHTVLVGISGGLYFVGRKSNHSTF